MGACVMVAVGMAAAADRPTRAVSGTYEAPLDIRRSSTARLIGRPTVTRAKDGARVRFEVSAPVDVEVAVLDKTGRPIRHVAAGLLGANAPEPFRKGSLKQDLLWDRRDDAGRPVPDGSKPYRVRVRVGATPKLEKHLGRDPDTMQHIIGLAVGDKGEVYVLTMYRSPASRCELRVLDRTGRYRRTIAPYSGAVPRERTKSVGHLIVDGKRLPIVYNGHAMALCPLFLAMPRQTMAWNPKGYLVAASATDSAFEFGLPRHLLAIHPEGGAPPGTAFVGPEISVPVGMLRGLGRSLYHRFDNLACSPDGKYVYYTGADTRIGSDYYAQPPRHAVFRFYWGEGKGEGMEEPFYGVDGRPGHAEHLLNDPRGLAVDADGNLYVCDRNNHRIVIVSPDAKCLGTFPVQDPEQVAVHPKTGEIYVLCRQRSTALLRKDHAPMFMPEYSAWRKRAKARWERRKDQARRPTRLLKFSRWTPKARPRERIRVEEDFGLMALDAGASPPRLWVTARGRLACFADTGDGLKPIDIPSDRSKGLTWPGHVIADPDRHRAIVCDRGGIRTLDTVTGAIATFVRGVREIAAAPDGTFCVIRQRGGKGLLQRLDADGNTIPLTPDGPETVDIGRFGPMGAGSRSLTVAPNGDIYLMRIAQEHAVQNRVDCYAADGTLRKAALIDGLGIGDSGLGVDASGNVYAGVNVKPSDARLPKAFRGKVPEANWLCWVQWTYQFRRGTPWYYSMRNEYLYHYGAVMKFGPAGGAMYGRGTHASETFVAAESNARGAALFGNGPADAPEYRSGYLYHRVRITGAKWRFPGMGIVPTSERYWGDPSCVCYFSGLDVDPYGRVFVPDCFQFCVHVLDANGNKMYDVGRYGNADDTGPAIHLGWPASVDACRSRLYVSDGLNRRVTIVRFEYADQAEVAF